MLLQNYLFVALGPAAADVAFLAITGNKSKLQMTLRLRIK